MITLNDSSYQQGVLDTVFEQVCDAGIWCERDCRFLHTWQEHHPYGMGTAAETLSECRCPDARECPGVQDWIREHKEDLPDEPIA